MNYSANEDAAQAFLSDKLSKNKYNSSDQYSTEGFDPSSYTAKQMSELTAFGGPTKFGKKSYDVVTNQDEIDAFSDSPGTATSTWDGKTYTRNSMDADDLKNHFGLQDGGDVGDGFNEAAGDLYGDRTKQNDLLGGGYLTNDKFEELRNTDKVWDAYAAMEGQAEADKKREKNPDGLSISALDGLLDNLTAEADSTDAPEPIMGKEEVVHSPEIQQAKARVGKYENDIISGKTSDTILGGANEFYDGYKLNLKNKAGSFLSDHQFNPGDTKFNGSDISPAPTPPKQEEATDSFLENMKKKVIKERNFRPAW
jgi:hypothetical protein